MLDESLHDRNDVITEEMRARKKRRTMRGSKRQEDAIVLRIGQWSTDHHVLTLSLLRRGPAHRRHVQMLNRYYELMYPVKSSQTVRDHSPGSHRIVQLSGICRRQNWTMVPAESTPILSLWTQKSLVTIRDISA